MSKCNSDSIRDYAFDELPAGERPAMERHISECAECAAELDSLRLTTAALRVLPDREPPQRIAFVSDKVFARSRFWNFAPWLGFASAAVMAVALMQRPVEIRNITTAMPAQTAAQSVDEIVERAVAKVREEDARMMKAALEASEARHGRQIEMVVDQVGVMRQELNTRMMQGEAAQ